MHKHIECTGFFKRGGKGLGGRKIAGQEPDARNGWADVFTNEAMDVPTQFEAFCHEVGTYKPRSACNDYSHAPFPVA
jgi:hypothetical protein